MNAIATETIAGRRRPVGRIRGEIDVQGRKCWALFDSGARYSYITKEAAAGLHCMPLDVPRHAALGGRSHTIQEVSSVFADIEGHRFEFHANVIDEIGKDEDGRAIEVLVGAIAMQLFGIGLDLTNERLDFTHFTTDFVEF